MTDQEKFEQWANDYALYAEPLTNIGRHADCKAAYLAAKQDSAAEITELKAEIEGYNLNYKDVCIDNLKLREALEKLANLGSGISPHYGNSQGNMLARQALASTSAQSLQAHDDEVIERCALVCDWDAKQSKQIGEPFAAAVAEILAEEIRELKGKP